MILDEIGQVNKDTLNKAITQIANEVYIAIEKCKELSSFLAGLSNDEFINIPPGPSGGTPGYTTTTKNHIKSFGTALLNIYEAFNNTTKTGIDTPSVGIIEMKNPIALK